MPNQRFEELREEEEGVLPDKPLNSRLHHNPDLHLIDEALPPPVLPPPVRVYEPYPAENDFVIGGPGAVGVSPYPAREDHVHSPSGWETIVDDYTSYSGAEQDTHRVAFPIGNDGKLSRYSQLKIYIWVDLLQTAGSDFYGTYSMDVDIGFGFLADWNWASKVIRSQSGDTNPRAPTVYSSGIQGQTFNPVVGLGGTGYRNWTEVNLRYIAGVKRWVINAFSHYPSHVGATSRFYDLDMAGSSAGSDIPDSDDDLNVDLAGFTLATTNRIYLGSSDWKFQKVATIVEGKGPII